MWGFVLRCLFIFERVGLKLYLRFPAEDVQQKCSLVARGQSVYFIGI